MGSTKMKNGKATRRLLAGMAAGLALLAFAERAPAQEILLTGPLAGAPAARKLRLHREGRFEIAIGPSFTLLDEYQRQIFISGRVNYNFTDWLAFGVWGAVSPDFLKINTSLSEEIQAVNEARPAGSFNRRLTAVNIGPDFTEQLGTMDWVVAPQLTLVPFRGKIAIFQSIFVDTDLYVFGGPAFVGVRERADCGEDTDFACTDPDSFDLASRMAIAPTFGLGFSFYINKWSAIGFEWRGLPFSRNTGGFDNRGADPDGRFPDLSVNDEDREFKFNQLLTVSFGIYLPTEYRVSE